MNVNEKETMKGFQFISRISTFILNLFVVRRVAPELFGIGNIHLQLYLNIVLLLSREGFRKAVTRYDFTSNNSK